MPEGAVDPYHFFVLLAVPEGPVDCGTFATVAGASEDETLATHLFLHHLYSFIEGYENI